MTFSTEIWHVMDRIRALIQYKSVMKRDKGRKESVLRLYVMALFQVLQKIKMSLKLIMLMITEIHYRLQFQFYKLPMYIARFTHTTNCFGKMIRLFLEKLEAILNWQPFLKMKKKKILIHFY